MRRYEGNASGLAAAGALLAGVAVALAAYANHGMEGDARAALQSAAVFAFGHGIALAALSRGLRDPMAKLALLALLAGTLLFAGAVVSRHLLGGPSAFAPWGGGLTMFGWLLYAISALRTPRR
ncbi:DUF423 domain-containing protein [Luteimonas sp. RC10]|uniref:DUF423 domain-containing protein n=1 Tax=Luteimonas sp. RC10 TaxID=2587035 RepID=UPI0017905BF9|nr:DUF423 domain-containing protein [Luteimonas sp. RC10]MBB3343320.1 uncharacterized membrane protein YgdD (TMEM256/DUF423 family) [Luteimonas sp. RC10]